MNTNISLLAKLLEESSADASTSAFSFSGAKPIVPAAPAQTNTVLKVGPDANKKVGNHIPATNLEGNAAMSPNDEDIWDINEVLEEHEIEVENDTRRRPKFDFFFKQNVGSEDNFLGLSGKTPSSIHCDILVIKLTMPGEDIRNVDLRVTPDQIIVEGSRYKLRTFLPLRVLEAGGNARWDSDTFVLTVYKDIDKKAREDTALGITE